MSETNIKQSNESQTAYDYAMQFMGDHSEIFEEVFEEFSLNKSLPKKVVIELREAIYAYGNAADRESFEWGFKMGRLLSEMTTVG